MQTITLANLRSEIASRADIEISASSGRHTEVRVNSLINASVRRYWLELAGHGDWAIQSATVSTATGTATTSGWEANQHVALASGFLKLKGASITVSGESLEMLPFQLSARDDYDGDFSAGLGIPLQYRVALNTAGAPILHLLPRAQAVYSIRYHYVATPALLVEDADAFSFFDGTEDLVICDVAKRILTRDGNEEPGVVQAIMQEREEARRVLIEHARNVSPGVALKRDTRGLRAVGAYRSRWVR
jgi:hypothetical protein